MIAMNILNVAGNALLVLVLHMGVAGVAIPTLISRMGAAFLVIYMTAKKKNVLRVTNFVTVRFQKDLLWQILRIGLPFAFENGMFYLGRLVVLSVVSTCGTAAIAASSVSTTLVMFEVLPSTAINLGLSVVIARCIGADDIGQAKYYTKKIIKIIYAGFVLNSIIMLSLMPLIMNIYSLSEEATAMTWEIMIAHAVMMVLIWPLGYSLPVIFRAAGDAKFPMVVSMLSMICCRIALSYVFVLGLGMGMLGTWAAMFMDWIAKAVIYTIRYKSGKWISFCPVGKSERTAEAVRKTKNTGGSQIMNKKYAEKLFPQCGSTLPETDPEFAELFGSFAFDEVVTHDDMDDRIRLMAILAALLDCQGLDTFREMLPAALNAGVTPVEAREIIYQATTYLGIGRVYPFLKAANEVFRERGISLPFAPQSTTTPETRRVAGTQAQVDVFGEKKEDFWKSGPEESRHINY